MLKRYDSKKLFYNKYCYKLTLINELSPIFRNKKFEYTKRILDDLTAKAESQIPLEYGVAFTKRVRTDHYHDAVVIYNYLTKSNLNYTLRVEGFSMNIFANDLDWLEALTTKVDCKEIHAPSTLKIENFLTYNPHTEIVKGPVEFEYKVYLSKTADKGVVTFLKNNKDNVKAGDTVFRCIEKGYNLDNLYIRVKNKRWLELCNIAIGSGFSKIIRLVAEDEII